MARFYSEKEKKALFREFALDDAIESESEAVDDVEIPRLVRKSQTERSGLRNDPHRPASSGGASKRKAPPSLRPTVSFPGDAPSVSNPKGTSAASDTKLPTNIAPSKVSHPATAKGKQMKAASGKGTKRKRDQPIKLVPEARQYLKGTSIHFIPSDDKHPVRKIQIRKTIELGAHWVKDWTEGITHVIVDKSPSLDYETTTSWITKKHVDPIPDSIAIVTYDWVVDCLRFEFQVNARQTQYYLKGYKQPANREPTSKIEVQTAISDNEASSSLVELHQPVDLPDGPSSEKVAKQTRQDVTESGTDLTPAPTLPNPGKDFDDELSKAIEEAQATKHLVSRTSFHSNFYVACLAVVVQTSSGNLQDALSA